MSYLGHKYLRSILKDEIERLKSLFAPENYGIKGYLERLGHDYEIKIWKNGIFLCGKRDPEIGYDCFDASVTSYFKIKNYLLEKGVRLGEKEIGIFDAKTQDDIWKHHYIIFINSEDAPFSENNNSVILDFTPLYPSINPDHTLTGRLTETYAEAVFYSPRKISGRVPLELAIDNKAKYLVLLESSVENSFISLSLEVIRIDKFSGDSFAFSFSKHGENSNYEITMGCSLATDNSLKDIASKNLHFLEKLKKHTYKNSLAIV